MKKNKLNKFSRVNIKNIYNFILIQNRSYFLYDIFRFNKKETINGNKSVNNNSNALFKKLSKQYIDKLSFLLYNSVNYKNYFLLRKNINNVKLYINRENNKQNPSLKLFHNQNSQSQTDLSNSNLYQIPEYNITYNINNDIKSILYNNNEKILDETKKNIFNKFQKKFLNYKPKLLSQLNSPIYAPVIPPVIKKTKRFSKIAPIKNNFSLNKSKSVSNLTPKNNNINNNIMSNLLRTCNSLKALRDKKILNKEILNDKQIFYEKIKEELKPIKIKKIKKKNILSKFDLFHYDFKKWKKNKVDTFEKKDREMFDDLNRQFNDNISYLKNKNDFYKDKLIKMDIYLKNKNISQMEIYNCIE